MRYLDGAGVAPVFDENNKKMIKADHFNSLRYAAALAGLSYWKGRIVSSFVFYAQSSSLISGHSSIINWILSLSFHQYLEKAAFSLRRRVIPLLPPTRFVGHPLLLGRVVGL